MNFDEAWLAIQPIRGWLGNKDQGRLMWDTAETGNVVEIGSYCGKSAVLMALAMKAVDAPYHVWCVDTFMSTNAELPDEDTYSEFLDNIIAYDVRDYCRPVRGSSHDPATALKVPKDAALVYVDGDHSYNGIMADIRIWRGHVRKGGMMMFHDAYGPEGTGPYSGQFPEVEKALKHARLARVLNNMHRIPPDAAFFRRSTCGCGGW